MLKKQFLTKRESWHSFTASCHGNQKCHHCPLPLMCSEWQIVNIHYYIAFSFFVGTETQHLRTWSCSFLRDFEMDIEVAGRFEKLQPVSQQGRAAFRSLTGGLMYTSHNPASSIVM